MTAPVCPSLKDSLFQCCFDGPVHPLYHSWWLWMVGYVRFLGDAQKTTQVFYHLASKMSTSITFQSARKSPSGKYLFPQNSGCGNGCAFFNRECVYLFTEHVHNYKQIMVPPFSWWKRSYIINLQINPWAFHRKWLSNKALHFCGLGFICAQIKHRSQTSSTVCLIPDHQCDSRTIPMTFSVAACPLIRCIYSTISFLIKLGVTHLSTGFLWTRRPSFMERNFLSLS